MNVALILLNQIDGTNEMTREMLPERVQEILKTLPEDADLQIMNGAEQTQENADLILLCSTTNDPRAKQLAAASGRRVCVDVDHFEEIDKTLYATRSIYSTHVEELIPVGKAAPAEEQASADQKLPAQNLLATIALPEPGREEEDLSKAKIVFLGGKGLGNKQNYERMEALAKKMGAAAACTRAAVLSGWAGYEKIIGVSGQSIRAELVIAFGVSGAGPLMRGMKGVKTLIAINTDKKASIFRYAQYGIAEDCVKILAELEGLMEG